tara:strand:+ start:213 stop:425 length:213 start_codon:yes stop_codon:yes gene_type:complete
MSLKHALLDALDKKYDAEIAAADATIKIYLTKSVGIGEHPQHLDEIDKQLGIITHANEKKEELKNFADDS